MASFLGSSDGPRTVTYNAPPETEARYKSQRVARVVLVPLVVSAGTFGAVTLYYALMLVWSAAQSWEERILHTLIAVGMVCALVALPLAAVLIRVDYAQWQKRVGVAWMVLFALALATGVRFALLTPLEMQGDAQLRAEELRSAIRWLESEAERDIWHATDECTKAPSRLQSRCTQIKNRRDAQWTELQSLEDDARWNGIVAGFMRLLMALASVVGAAGAPLVLVLAYSQSHRIAEGTANLAPAAVAPTTAAEAVHAPVLMTPQQAFDMWWNGNVRVDPIGTVAHSQISARAAYASYSTVLQATGLPVQNEKKFFTFMTAKAQGSGGRIWKPKASTISYAGCALVNDNGLDRGALQVIDVQAELLALPYRKGT